MTQSAATSKRNIFPHLALAAIAALALLYAWWVFAPSDDAYIFLVYANNFIHGHGLTFNGTLVEGFSSPLWVALLSLLGLTRLPLPFVLHFLGALSGLFALFAAYRLGNVLLKNAWWALLAPALLAATGDFVFYTASGLEEVLFTGLVALSMAEFLADPHTSLKNARLPFLLTLTILARPEGVLFAAAIYLAGWAFNRSLWPPVRSGLLLTGMLAPILALKRLYYGYWLPNTYFVKSGSGFANILHGKVYLAQNALRYAVIAGLFVIFLAVVLLWQRKTQGWQQVGFLLAAALVWLAYVFLVGGDNLVGGRILVPMLPLVYAALVYLVQSSGLSFRWAGVLILLTAAVLIFGYVQDEEIRGHAARWRRNFTVRKNIGLYLKANYPPDTLVALNPAGIIPFYSELPTIDMLGLNDTAIAHHGDRDYSLPFGHQAGDGEYILSRQPQIILLGGTASKVPGGFLSDQQIGNSEVFQNEYHLETWPGMGYAFVRNDSGGE